MSFSDEWFEGVYGKEPYPQKSETDLYQEVQEAQKRLLWAETAMNEREIWNTLRIGAQAAWRKLEGENVAKRLADDEADNIRRAMVVLVNLLSDKYDCATFRPLGVAEAVASKVRGLEYRVKELEGKPEQQRLAGGSIVRELMDHNNELSAQVRTLVAKVKELEGIIRGLEDRDGANVKQWDDTVQKALRRIVQNVPDYLNALGVAEEVEKEFRELEAEVRVQKEARWRAEEAAASRLLDLEKSIQELKGAYASANEGQKRYAKLASDLMVSNELLRGELEESELRKAKGGDAD